MSIIIGILWAIAIFAVLVIVHEGGHFLAAKAMKVKVNEFSVGMGPQIFRKQKGETVYSVRAFPIGGFVAMEGESEASDDERSFEKKSALAKAFIIAAGPVMNFLLAVIILAGIITYMGTSVSADLAKVEQNSPAYEAGLRAGDRITEVDGVGIGEGSEAVKALAEAAGGKDSVAVSYLTKESGFAETAVSEISFADLDEGQKRIGITFDVNHNPIKGLWLGIKSSFYMEKEMLSVLGDLFTGKGSADDLVGPVGIVDVVDKTAQKGMFNLIYLMALLSLNLGLVNILPFPALDGGRLLFIIIRRITGKMITDELENKIHFIGIMLLFALMIAITMKDINTFIL
ncbi:MAG: site-2 protease family protein [Firmicutes bacterium]|nr:site-2 protease family protein [Bacillota bacterium]